MRSYGKIGKNVKKALISWDRYVIVIELIFVKDELL